MKRRRWPRLGLRREVLILLPVTLLLLVLVSTFTLFAYRSAIQLLLEDRQREALALARGLIAELRTDPWPTLGELRRLAPTADSLVVIDPGGRTVLGIGEPPVGRVAVAAPPDGPAGPTLVGPDAGVGESVIVLAPFDHRGERHVVRLELPAQQLARQQRTVRRLTWVVLPTNLALLLLVLLYLPHFLRPYDTLIQQVQRVAEEAEGQDEVSLLVSTVDRALEALTRASEERREDDIAALQRALGASLESGLLLLDGDGRVLTLNPVGAELLEVDPTDRPIPVADKLQAHPGLLAMLTQAVAASTGLPRQEIRIQTSAGQRTLGFTVHALRRDDGTVRGHLALFVDLTESQREAEARQLASSLERLGELAAGVAHELRNSLATLRGYLTLIERHPQDSAADYLQEIRRESDHLQRVVEDFLAFAQPESTRIETVDLLEIVARAAADPALEGFRVEVEAERAVPTRLPGDPQLLERAVRNLLHNAARAESDAGRAGPLRVRLRRAPEAVELLIDDRGAGVPEAIRGRLFQPFVTSRADGVGLGLALTHRILTLHRGRLRLEDRRGGGTRAAVRFPADVFV